MSNDALQSAAEGQISAQTHYTASRTKATSGPLADIQGRAWEDLKTARKTFSAVATPEAILKLILQAVK